MYWISSAVCVFLILLLLSIEGAISISSLDSLYTAEYNATMKWGTYRPGVYFGTRSRDPLSVLHGLAWSRPDGLEIHHDCKQDEKVRQFGWLEHDGASYGYQEIVDDRSHVLLHTSFAKHADRPGEIFHTRVVARPLAEDDTKAVSLLVYVGVEDESGHVVVDEQVTPFKTKDGKKHIDASGFTKSGKLRVGLTGSVPHKESGIGDFRSLVEVSAADGTAIKVFYHSLSLDDEDDPAVKTVWNAEHHLSQHLKRKKVKAKTDAPTGGPSPPPAPQIAVLQDTTDDSAKLVFLQLLVKPPADGITIDTHFFTRASLEALDDATVNALLSPSPSEYLTQLLDAKSAAFHDKYRRIFPVKPTGGGEDWPTSYEKVAKAAFSNLIGGLGYFHGPLPVAKGAKPRTLTAFSAVPSRSFFPRPFLWDEGFHGMVISKWDSRVFLDVLVHWMGLMDTDGWIPREPALCEEALTRVPEQFRLQSREVANPPSLVLPLMDLIDAAMENGKCAVLSSPDDPLVDNSAADCSTPSAGESQWRQAIDPALLSAVASSLYPRLSQWYHFLKKSQASKTKGCYRWHQRTTAHTYGSGFDDYPRGVLPTTTECHLDLHVWMIVMASAMLKLTKYLLSHSPSTSLTQKDVSQWSKEVTQLRDFLVKDKTKLYDPSTGLLADYMGEQPTTRTGALMLVPPWRTDGRCGEEFKQDNGKPGECDPYSPSPCCSPSGWCGSSPQHCQCEGCTISLPLEKRPKMPTKAATSPHIGVVSLFPFLFGILADQTPAGSSSTWLGKQLPAIVDDVMLSEDRLWSRAGLRSLSKSDVLFGSGENYWRSNVWININFLALRAIKKYYLLDREEGGSGDVTLPGPLRASMDRLYWELRERLVATIMTAYEKQGYMYESYHERSGRGLGAAPFTGWTATVVLIVAELF
ncbi:unnamed protein product [Vitrella brassicaformis CCMP3155]|uniref:Mannosyl-oligosaccharide glucosidase n=1 Tax=Vitrella brassicaformis (strain CCMP3155) TaxID=1169540 RepID=A0A0G4G9A6_VITBC|nr:unnamed protein product [Vitrella brassicaformis CCMP3155]|eukprot:CEM25414.1 unnamed protein product [Vitrella brassicaformis CCMP3155]